MKLSGVIIPNVTPLTASEGLDHAGLDRLIEFLLGAGIHGLFVNGSMGGFALLADAVQLEAIGRTVERTRRRVPVLAGISETSTIRVVAKLRSVERLGPDALVVMPPFYYVTRQDELAHFFRTVADAATLPIVLYDNPKLAKNSLAADTIGALASHPNIVGAKISAPDAFKWQEVLRQELPRDRFALICGAEPMMSLALQLGFDGVTGGLHNLAPGLAVSLFEAARAGRFDECEAVQRKLNRLLRVFEIDGGWRGAELALSALGICEKVTASPHDLRMLEARRQEILAILAREAVLPHAASSAVRA